MRMPMNIRSVLSFRAAGNPARRRGVAAVEFAVVLPLLIFFILSIIEFGRILMVQQLITNGARQVARMAVVANSSQSEVEANITEYMTTIGLQDFEMDITDLATIQPGEPVTVTVSIPYKDCSWLPGASINGVGDKTLSATVTMIKEANFDGAGSSGSSGSDGSGTGDGSSGSGSGSGKGKIKIKKG